VFSHAVEDGKCAGFAHVHHTFSFTTHIHTHTPIPLLLEAGLERGFEEKILRL
jgi:hypothetical protein